MVSSTAAFAILFFSRQAGASPAGVFANIASCKCLTAAGNGGLKTMDCTTDLQDPGSQSFYTQDLGRRASATSLHNAAGPVCVGNDPNETLIGQRAELGSCVSEGLPIYVKLSRLVVTVGNSSYDLQRTDDDTLVFAEPDDADDHLFEFHCAACFGDEGWTCGGAPAPGPSPDPAPTPAPVPIGNTTTSAPTPPNTTLAPDPTPSPWAEQIQWIKEEVNLCMDLPGGDVSNGALLGMWDCYGGDTQQWSFQDGQLVYLPDPSKCVDLLGADTTNGNKLGIWDCYQGDTQMWSFNSDSGTIHLASSIASHAPKCATVGGEHRGDPIVVWDCSEHDGGQDSLYQTWKVGSPALSLAVV